MTGPSQSPKAAGTPNTDPDEHRYQADAANYIAEMAASLAKIARSHRLDALGYILDMARLEAESVSRHTKGPA